MRKGAVVWIIVLLAVIFGIAIIDAGVKRPIDWSKSFNIRHKIPYGLFVLHEELPNLLGKDRVYRDFGGSFYEEIERLDSMKKYDVTLIGIDQYPDLYNEDTKKIIRYVEQGGEVFLSALYFEELLMDTLGISSGRLDYVRFQPNDQRITYTLAKDTNRIKVDKSNDFWIFDKLNANNCTVLGHLHSRGRALPNFIRVAVGKGNIYLHLQPEVFANCNILQEDSYQYVAKALQVIGHKEILFSDAYYEWEKPRTPLRVILTQPGFYQAWYLLLLGLFLLLVFKSKREQRAIPVVRPEPNLSKDFAKTIGNLYYENGHPGNIIHKKIDYFLFALRSHYHLDTLDILDEKFLKQLSSKSRVDLAETTNCMQRLQQYRQRTHHPIDTVKTVNNIIEDFKQKAHIL